MKQTNNAIKFLMAQYRAIFKNANIAMAVALATAALAAGQAQAASATPKDVDNTLLPQLSGEVTIDGTGQTDDANPLTYKNLVLTGTEADTQIGSDLQINITSGAHTIKGVAEVGANPGPAAPAKSYVNLGNTSFVLGNTDAATLTIGEATGGKEAATNVTMGDVTINKGTLALAAKADDAKLATTVAVQNLTVGKAGAATDDAKLTIVGNSSVAANAITLNSGSLVEVGKSGALTTAGTLTMNDGKFNVSGTASASEISLVKGALTVAAGGTLSGDSISVSDGTLAVAGTASAASFAMESGAVTVDGTLDSKDITLTSGTLTLNAAAAVVGAQDANIVINGGKVTDATAAGGTLKGAVSLEKGEIAVTSGSTIDGAFTANGGTIKTSAAGKALTLKGTSEIGEGVTISNSGTIVVEGTASILADVAKITTGADGMIQLNAAGNTTTTLNVSKATFDKLVSGQNSKLVFSGAATGDTNEVHFTDTTTIDIEAAGVLKADGSLGDKFSGATSQAGKLMVSAADVKYEKNALTADLTVGADTLLLGDGTAAFNLNGAASGLVVGKTLTISGSKDLTLTQGQLDLTGADGSSGNAVNAGKITVGDAATAAALNVTAGEWTVKGLEIVSGDATVTNDAILKITGDLTTKSATETLIAQNSATIDAKGAGKVTLAAGGVDLQNASTLILDAADVFDASGDKLTTYADGAVTGSSNSTINLMSGDAFVTMSKDKFMAFTKTAGFAGLWGVTINDLVPEGKNELVMGGTGSEMIAGLGTGYENVQGQVDGTAPLDGVYSAGNIGLTKGDNLTIGAGSITLQNSMAADGNGMFVSKPGAKPEDPAVLAGVKFDATATADSSITFEGSGKVGAITTATAGSGDVTFGAANKTGAVSVEGGIGTDGTTALAVGNVFNNGSAVSVTGDVYTHELTLTGGNLSLASGKKLVLGDGQTYDATTGAGLDSTINGNVVADSLSIAAATTGTLDIANGAVLDLGTLDVSSAVDVVVGNASSSATILADNLVLNGGKLLVDPAYGNGATKIIVGNITDTATATDAKIAGDILIGQNFAVSIGYTEAEFNDVMADYLVYNGGFSDQVDGRPVNGVKNALVLNKSVEVADNFGIVIDPAGTTNPDTLTGSKVGNALVMKNGAALVISDAAFGADKTGPAIKFLGTTTSAGKVTAETGSKVILTGDFDESANALKIAVDNTNAVVSGLENLSVEYAGGLMKGVYDATTKTFAMKVDEDMTGAVYDGIARPVGDLIMTKLYARIADKSSLGYEFLRDMISSQNYKAVDAAAHAATYAGAQQAAVASVTTMADAVVGRVGTLGVEAASITATGSQANGGVWVTPMYKSMDSDGFGAEGGSYGADVDLAGVAFGSDTVNGNMRFGAVFNLGSGDADGKGNGEGLKDEFDYYGFGIYSAMVFGNLALVGDASLTVINHDVEGLGLTGEADTSAVTMGLTGQYTFATPMVDVTPHLGARFIRLDTDSYSLDSAAGTLAVTDFDVQNVFSVPLGVTLSKAFTTGGWALAPSADLTMTFNTGDTDAKSNFKIAGQNASLTTEVLDEVQYGVTLGLGAQYGSFGTSFGVNYTGSSNTDSFGVNAQARYVF